MKKAILSLCLALIMVISIIPGTVISAASAITIQPVDFVGATGSPATFSVTAEGEGVTYQWQQQTAVGGNWSNINNQTANTYRTGNVTVALTANRYRCLVTSGGETTASNEVRIFALYNVSAAIGSIGISATDTSRLLRRNFAFGVTEAQAGNYKLVLNCGGAAIEPESKITVTVDGVASVITGDDIPFGVGTTRGNVLIDANFAAGSHTIAIDAELVPVVGGMNALQVESLSAIPFDKVPSPVFSKAAGTYGKAVKLSFTLPNAIVWKNASIRYTTDGADPTETTGTAFDGNGFPVFPASAAEGSTVTVKAAAFLSGKLASDITAVTYTLGSASAPILSPIVCNRDSAQLTSSNASGITLTAVDEGVTIYYTMDGSEPTVNSEKYVAPLKVLGATTLKAAAIDADGNKSEVLTREYTLLSANPTAIQFPANSAVVGKGSAIGLSNATSASKATRFYYTTDGTDPTTASTLYTGNIPVPVLAHNEKFIIKAIAAGEGLVTSGVATFEYTYDAETPRLSEIKSDPDFIAWKDSNFQGDPPASLLALIDKIFKHVPRNSTANVGLYSIFGGGGSQGNGVPGSAWRSTGLRSYGIPDLHSFDGPAGIRLTAESGVAYERSATYWPNGSLRSAAWNTELSEQMGNAWGKEINYFAANVILAPGFNIHRNVLNGRNFEYFSEDPMLSGLTGAAEVRGIQTNPVGVSVKHFAMNQQETNRSNYPTNASTRAIREIYLRSFQYVQENSSPWTYMTAFNEANGIHCAQNYDLITRILRGEWGFKNLVMTDYNGYGNMNDLYPYYDTGLAPNTHSGLIKAGNELALATGNANNVMAGATSGYLTEEDLRRGFERICVYSSKHGVFNDVPWHFYNDDGIKATNNAIAEQLAEEGAILLKNNNKTLPLSKTAAGKVLSLGQGASQLFNGGTGSGGVNMTAQDLAKMPHLPEAISAIIGEGKVIDSANMNFPRVPSIPVTGAMMSPFPSGKQEIVVPDAQFAAWGEEGLSAIVFVLQRESGEGADIRVQKGAYYLSDAEETLINQGSALAKSKGIPFVIILNTGSWVEMESWQDKADAILQCWNTGQVGATPMARLLFGDVNPSGKLPTTVPVSVVGKDENGYLLNPSEGEFGMPTSTFPKGVQYREGVFVGYRYYDKYNVPVSYPFGYGLSYTTFDFSSPALSKTVFTGADDKLTASVTVTNSGDVAGKEVAQFYIGAPGVSMIKPVKELKGYAKTALLAKGENQTVTAEFGAMSLASYDEVRGMWVVEPGTYTVYFAASSKDIRAEKTFTVEQEIIASVVNKDAMAPVSAIPEYTPSDFAITVKTTRTRASIEAIDTAVAVVNTKDVTAGKGVIILAMYDEAGKLISLKNLDIDINAAKINDATEIHNWADISANVTNGAVKVKAFLWEQGNLVPLNDGKFIDLK